jgi:hypothetical protein
LQQAHRDWVDEALGGKGGVRMVGGRGGQFDGELWRYCTPENRRGKFRLADLALAANRETIFLTG